MKDAFKILQKVESRVVLMSWRFLKSAKAKKLSYSCYCSIHALAVFKKTLGLTR